MHYRKSVKLGISLLSVKSRGFSLFPPPPPRVLVIRELTEDHETI